MIPLLLAASSTPSVHAESYWQKQANKLLDTRQHKPGKLTSDEIGRAFKQALNLGADQVVARLGKTDGFNTDSVIRILLPDDLQKARKLLKTGIAEKPFTTTSRHTETPMDKIRLAG